MDEKKRLSRQRRSIKPPNMRLMPRDIEILKTIAACRILRQDHIQQLFFNSKSTAQYRLSHLYQHGFLERHFLPVYAGWSPTLYTLDKRGLAVLKSEHGIQRISTWDSQTGHEFLSHTLAINDFRIAMTVACRESNYLLAQWQGEADLKANYDRVVIVDEKGKKQSVSLIPDSYFMLETPLGKAAFFLEMDMGTMTLSRFQNKIRAYYAYAQNGAYQQRYQTKSLRILTITSSPIRVSNLRVATEQITFERLFWYTSQAQVSATAVLHLPIWQVPGNSTLLSLIPR